MIANKTDCFPSIVSSQPWCMISACIYYLYMKRIFTTFTKKLTIRVF